MKFTFATLAIATIATTVAAAAVQVDDHHHKAEHNKVVKGKWFDRFLYIIMENTDVAFSLANPTFKKIADRKDAIFQAQMYGVTHPSEPNYIAGVAGSTFGIADDADYNITGHHLLDLLDKKKVSWKVYAEDYPKTNNGECYLGDWNVNKTGGEVPHEYVRKHVPFLSFTNVQNSKERCAKIVNAKEFQKDFDENKLPQFIYYVPNLEDDGHDSTIDFQAEYLEKTWMKRFDNPKLLKNTAIYLTYDETSYNVTANNYDNPNHIYSTVFGGAVKNAHKYAKTGDTTHYTHYSVAATVEHNWRLGNLGRNDTTANVFKF